jgi:tetratricopeptide (TPR) repeat protein
MIWNALMIAAALAATAPAAKAPKHKTAKEPAVDVATDPIGAGLADFKKKRFARAEADFEKAVEANPQSAAAHFYLGYSIYKTAEPKKAFHPDKQKAAAEFAKAYELDPTFRPEWGPKGR